MRWIFAFAILVSLDSCVGLAAKPCQELPSSVECITSPESMKIIIARAREVVLASKLELNKKERYGIIKNNPVFWILFNGWAVLSVFL